MTWIWPALITALAFIIAIAHFPKSSPYASDYNYGKAVDAFVMLTLLGAATIVALFSWLVWSLV